MITTTLQQIIDKRISLPKPETNRDENKQQVNESFHIQIHAMRFVDKEDVETIILPKKTLMKNSKYVHEGDRNFVELYGLKGRQRQIPAYSLGRKEGTEVLTQDT
jgi:hypothetical protein